MRKYALAVLLSTAVLCAPSAHAYGVMPMETDTPVTLPNGTLVVTAFGEIAVNGFPPFSERLATTGVPVGARKLYRAPGLALAFGLGKRIELQAEYETYYLDQNPKQKNSKIRTGDMRFFTKVRFNQEGEILPALGIRFGAKLSNASEDDGIGTNQNDFYAWLLGEKKIGPTRWLANVGLGTLDSPIRTLTQDDVLSFGIAVGLPITEQLTWWNEFAGNAQSRDLNNYRMGRTGLRLERGPLAYFVSAAVGVTPESPSWEGRAGLSYRIDGLDF